MQSLLWVLVILATLGGFAVVAFRGSAGPAGLEDYLVARNSQGGTALGLSFLASGLGAWVLFAPPEIAAGVGAVALVGYAVGAVAPFLVFAALGGRLRAVLPGGHSIAEFARLRFGAGLQAVVAGVSALYMLVFLAAELTAVGAIVAIVAGVDPRLVVVAVAGVTLAYTTWGGLRASLRTDRWQAWCTLALLALAAGAVLASAPADGWAVPAELLAVERVGIEAALTLVLAVTAANLFHQGYWQRLWAARDVSALRRGVAIGTVSSAAVVLGVGAIGLLAVGAGLDLGSPPAPFFAVLAGLPRWVGVAVVVLGVALVASSVDTLENAVAALVVSERPTLGLRGARLVTVAAMLPIVVIALQGLSVLRLFLVADLLCAMIAVPVLLGLWRRATAAGAVAGCAAGVVGAVLPGWLSTGALVEGVRLATFPGAIPTLPPFAGALLASSAVAVGVSLLGSRAGGLDTLHAVDLDEAQR